MYLWRARSRMYRIWFLHVKTNRVACFENWDLHWQFLLIDYSFSYLIYVIFWNFVFSDIFWYVCICTLSTSFFRVLIYWSCTVGSRSPWDVLHRVPRRVGPRRVSIAAASRTLPCASRCLLPCGIVLDSVSFPALRCDSQIWFSILSVLITLQFTRFHGNHGQWTNSLCAN